MTEALYRGKRTDNGAWIEGWYIFDMVRDIAWIVRAVLNGENNPEFYYAEVDPETVAPWSGMSDKDGKRIFRDDILAQIDRRNPKNTRHCIVKYGEFNCSCCNGVYGWTLDGQCADIRDFEGDMWSPRYKVVGNIHDNPELIEAWERENLVPFYTKKIEEAKE